MTEPPKPSSARIVTRKDIQIQNEKMRDWTEDMYVRDEFSATQAAKEISYYKDVLELSEGERAKEHAEKFGNDYRSLKSSLEEAGHGTQEIYRAIHAVRFRDWKNDPKEQEALLHSWYIGTAGDPQAREAGDAIIAAERTGDSLAKQEAEKRFRDRAVEMGVPESHVHMLVEKYPSTRMGYWESSVDSMAERLPEATVPEWEPFTQERNRQILKARKVREEQTKRGEEMAEDMVNRRDNGLRWFDSDPQAVWHVDDPNIPDELKY